MSQWEMVLKTTNGDGSGLLLGLADGALLLSHTLPPVSAYPCYLSGYTILI